MPVPPPLPPIDPARTTPLLPSNSSIAQRCMRRSKMARAMVTSPRQLPQSLSNSVRSAALANAQRANSVSACR
jgi:hypothetical protein